MTELKVGSLVRSACGRDRKRVFVVVGIDENDPVSPVFVADGKLRKANSPKKKNPIHLLPFGEITDIEKNALKDGVSDEEIAQIVEKYDRRCKD
jgi:ribosomal protein L14E/L6E/L27E